MATPSPVRLLIADRSENRAHEIDSILRDAGISTRPAFECDLESAVAVAEGSAETAAGEQHVDLMLCDAQFDALDQVLPGLRKRRPDLPIIVMHANSEPTHLTRGMAIGATDVVFEDDNERLLYVVQRELNHVCDRHRLAQTRRALQEAERRCELLLANSTAAIAYVHEGMHIFANDDYLKMFGFKDVDELLGLPLLDLMESNFADEYKAKIKSFPDGDADVAFAFCGRDVNGEPVQGEMSLSSAEFEGESCTQVLVRNQTIPAEPQPIAQPAPTQGPAGLDEFIATLDAASGAINTLLVIEIDHFDALEAEQGLLWSDQIVNEVQAQMLVEAQAEASGAILQRIGHCRFALAAPGASRAGMDVIAERLREFVENALFEVNGKTIRCTVTVGGVEKADNVDLAGAVDLAFNTLCAQRADGGGNTISWYNSEAEKSSPEHANGGNSTQQRILQLVNTAVEESKFVLLFQPIISLRGDLDEHYEVFLRLLDEKGEQLAPHEFLELAIKNGVAGKIDRWVILQSIKLLSVHRSKGNNTRLTINLTSNSLIDEEFIQWLGVAIKAARLPSDAVVFQIAEPDAVDHVRQAREFISGLKKMHIRTSMRHFGVTDQSFETLRHIPVEFVKLDGKHAQDVIENPERKDQLTEMIKELQAQGKLTIVPMVESATVLSALWQAGANFIQGHYLQEPSTEMSYDFSADDT